MSKDTALDWFRFAPGWLVVVGPDNRIIEISNDLANCLKHDREDLIGTNLLDLAVPQVTEVRAVGNATSAATAGLASDVRVNLRTRSRQLIPGRLHERRIPASSANQSNFSVISIEDLRAEDALRQELDDQTRLSLRFGTHLSEFTHLAAHDLHEPLRKIKQFANLLTENYPEALEEDATYYLNSMVRASDRMGALVNRLLEFSRARNEVFESDTVNIFDAIESACEQSVPQSMDIPGEVVETSAGRDLIVLADRFWLERLFKSIFDNALLYRSPNRKFILSVSVTPSANHNNAIRITIADNGIGFDPKHAERIFEPFRRLHSRQTYPGAGMGLAIAQTICERLGWSIEARGEPDRGASFIIEVPDAGKSER